MSETEFELPTDPKQAVEEILRRSHEEPVLIFKKSPICPVSHRAEAEYRAWLTKLPPAAAVQVAEIDVIEQKPLARGLSDEIDIKHESPQAFWFSAGEVKAHGSHGDLIVKLFDQWLEGVAH